MKTKAEDNHVTFDATITFDQEEHKVLGAGVFSPNYNRIFSTIPFE